MGSCPEIYLKNHRLGLIWGLDIQQWMWSASSVTVFSSIEEKLRIEKKGICTLYEFFIYTVKEYPVLGSAFSEASSGTALQLEYAITRFENNFAALKHPSDETLSVITIMAVNHFCPDVAHKLKSILVAAATFTEIQRKAIKPTDNPTRRSSFDTVPMSALPGITEIRNGSVSLGSFKNFVISRLAFVPDRSVQLERCKEAFYSLNGSEHSDCDLLFAEEEKLFIDCSSWKKSAFLDDYDRADHFISICLLQVQLEYAESAIELSNMD